MKIGVIGAGRLGICFALLAESAGHDVYVSDISPSYVNKLVTKTLYSNEPEVEDLLLRSTKLRATTSNSNVIKSSDVIFTSCSALFSCNFGGCSILVFKILATLNSFE